VSVTTEPAFYDRAMTDAHEPAMLPLEESPWLELYRQASWMIPASHPVVDLGCGTGRFAEQLRRRGHGRYQGVDFSPAAVAEADRYVSDHNSDTGWSRDFAVVDLRDWTADDERAGTTVYTCLETLEHLEDDVDLIRRIPVGHELIFSVPNYGGEAHLRSFANVSDAWQRYGHLLSFRSWILVGGGPRYFIHLYRAVRRPDSW
jgi:2-polyprenyl-3-methyl-5-hydroxy-6-metoxy-1,4-benzoquinol methylase